MTDSPRPKMSDEELLYKVLGEIESRGGAIESELYGLVGTARRLRPILDRLSQRGLVDVVWRDTGRRVRVYHLTDCGRLLLYVDGMRHELLGSNMDDSSGEISLETGQIVRIQKEFENVQRLMRVVFVDEDDRIKDDCR